MSDNKELKPCPFCGGAARIESNRDWHKLTGDHDDQCVFFEEEVMVVPAQDEHRTAMIDDWNRRAAQPVVLSDDRIIEIRNSIWDEVKGDDEYDQADIAFAKAILAAKEQA